MTITSATILVKGGQANLFEHAGAQARAILRHAQGWLGFALHRCIEEPLVYHAVIRWASARAHMVDVREGPLFAEWRSLVAPYFASPPVVRHFTRALDNITF